MQTNLAGQVWQVVFHRVPEHIEIDFRIPVDGAVSHAGESSPRDLADDSRRRGRQRLGRFADFGHDVLGRTNHQRVSVERCPAASNDQPGVVDGSKDVVESPSRRAVVGRRSQRDCVVDDVGHPTANGAGGHDIDTPREHIFESVCDPLDRDETGPRRNVDQQVDVGVVTSVPTPTDPNTRTLLAPNDSTMSMSS